MGASLHQKSGQILCVTTASFMTCFAVWTIFSIVGVPIRQDLGLSETQFGLLLGTPILTGSLIRVVLGIWADFYGGRVVLTATMLVAAIATFLLSRSETYNQVLMAAVGIGVAGGSFAAGISYVTRWYPPERQAAALGIFGSGNVGAAATSILAPFVLVAYGWQTVALVWAVWLIVMATIFWFTSEDDPAVVERRRAHIMAENIWLQLEPLKNAHLWRFALYYFFTFGSFVAIALWLPQYLMNVYGLDIKAAGLLTAFFTVPASIFRRYGGRLSDSYGARRVLYWTLLVSSAATDRICHPWCPGPNFVSHGDGPCWFYRDDSCAGVLHGAW